MPSIKVNQWDTQPKKPIKPTKAKKNKGGAGDGLFQDKNTKTWGYRVSLKGKPDIRRKGFKTKTEAKRAREDYVAEQKKQDQIEQAKINQEEDLTITLQEVYDHYIKYGSMEKRPATLKKQSAMWRNHIEPEWGNRPICSLTVGEINNYLVLLYRQGDNRGEKRPLAYKSVEGYLKFMYLFFGYALGQGWINKSRYSDFCESRGLGIKMPKIAQEDVDDEEVEVYTKEEFNLMAERLKTTDLLTALLLGYYLGVRVSECFGLMWSDINWTQRTITIQRQLNYESPYWVTAPVKTLKAVRVIEIPTPLYAHLKDKRQEEKEHREKLGLAWQGVETVRVRIERNQDDPLTSGDFINRTKKGRLLTTDSIKSWGRKMYGEVGVHLKYHNLRHTHASTLAALNTPLPKLMERLGHKKISTTQKYYLGKNEIADEKLKENLNLL